MLSGQSLSSVAKANDISYSALQRHMERHRGSGQVAVDATPVTPETTATGSGELDALLAEAKRVLSAAGSNTQRLDAIDKVLKILVAAQAYRDKHPPAMSLNIHRSEVWFDTRRAVIAGCAEHDRYCNHKAGDPHSARMMLADSLNRAVRQHGGTPNEDDDAKS